MNKRTRRPAPGDARPLYHEIHLCMEEGRGPSANITYNDDWSSYYYSVINIRDVSRDSFVLCDVASLTFYFTLIVFLFLK